MTPHDLEEMMQDPPTSCRLMDYPVTSDEESDTIVSGPSTPTMDISLNSTLPPTTAESDHAEDYVNTIVNTSDSLQVDVTMEPVQHLMESSMEDDTVDVDISDDDTAAVSYRIVATSSKRGQSKLFDSSGYSYTVKKVNISSTVWRCTVRNKHINCAAKVIQHGDMFIPGNQPHLHTSKPGSSVTAEITSTVKRAAVADVFQPASVIVEDALTSRDLTNAPCAALPNPAHLARAANRLRQRLRPDELSSLDFELDYDHIPSEFLQADVQVGARRHLIFATPEMLKYLAHSKRWYMDATFHVVKAPFTQLFSVHSFLQQDVSPHK